MALYAVPNSRLRHTVEQRDDAYYVAQVAKMLALEMGFSDYNSGMLASAVSEITVNVVHHGNNGWASVQPTGNGKGVEVRIEDKGSGIDNLSKAFIDGFSTYGSLGLGLGAARRSVDEMIVNKNDATGLSITLRHYLPLSPDDIDVAAISFPANGQIANGDAYIIKGYEGECLLAVLIDGAGKGEKAAVAARIAVNAIEEHYKSPLDDLIMLCDKAIRQSLCKRPAEMCLLRLTPDTVEFAGIGNVVIHSQTNPGITFPIQNGSAGMVLPDPIHITRHRRPDNFLFILHSDGVLPGGVLSLMKKDESAYANAQFIFDQNATSQDDATVIVIKG